MSSLQEIVYKQLPRSIKKTIVTQKETYPEYNEVVSRLNNDILSRFKTKVKLTKTEIALTSILLSVYYHIKNNPPEFYLKKKNKKNKNPVISAWDDFTSKNYPFYDDVDDDIDRWPKFMFLLYHTYKLSYRGWYNLEAYPELINIPKFDRITTRFISYIYSTYKYLDRNTTLSELRDWGY